jgi:UTP--glucose-1-phosphate uridylyltransferase
MFGVQFNGTRHDIGNPAGFIKANLEFALQRPEMADSIRHTIHSLAGS